MAEKNVVSQRIRLDASQYRSEIKRLNSESKSELNQVNGTLQRAGSSFRDYGNTVKKSAGSVGATLKEMGKSIGQNAAKGLLIGGSASMIGFTKNGISQAARSMLSFGEAMSRVKLKTNASKQEIDSLQDSLSDLARTGASLSSIPDAFDEIFSATGDIEKSKSIMQDISQFASGTSDRDASRVAEFVRKNLTSQNKELNVQNTKDLLGSVASMVKTGSFKNLDEAMGSLGEVDVNALSQSKISNRSVAAMLSAASGVSNKEQSVAAVNEIVKGSANAFSGNAVLNGMLGGYNLLKNGQLNSQALLAASQHYKKSGLKDADFKGLLVASGLSEDAANGLINILKNSDKFVEGIDKFNKGSTDAVSIVDSLTDNLSLKLQRLFGGIEATFIELFHHLMNLDFKGVLHDIIGHPGQIAGSAAVIGASGVAASFGLKSISGLLGFGGATSAGTGAAAAGTGAAAAGGTTAAGEVLIGSNVSALGIGPGAAVASAGGGSTLAALAAPVAVGAAGAGIGLGLGKLLDAYQGVTNTGTEDFLEKHVGESAANLYKRIDALVYSLNQFVMNGFKSEVKVEVDSKDPGYLARPKATDHPRDPRGL